MQVNALSQTNDTSQSSSTQSSGMNTMFLQLLIAQLKTQAPFDPLDPNQFVNQLAQFNTLNEVMTIRQLLQQFTTPPTTSKSETQGG